MRKNFILFLILWGTIAQANLLVSSDASTQTTQLQQVNHDIEKLEAMKRGYDARALRHEDQADRLQFDDQTYLEMRRHNQLATENRQKAAAVQKEIDRLKAEREKLIQT